MERVTDQLCAVQRMQDYINQHLDEVITPPDLSRASCYSPFYAMRLFKDTVGLSPATYVRRLRLSRSALRLKNGESRLIDAAFEAGFDSVDGYTRAFYKTFGCLPGAYARHPVPISLFVPYSVKFKEMYKEEKTVKEVQSVFIQTVNKPQRRVILRRGKQAEDYLSYCEEVGCDVWGLLTSMDSLCGEPVCLWLPQGFRPVGTSVYVQGVEVPIDDECPIPDGFDCITLPSATYLMFQGEPFKEEAYCEAITAVQTAMDRYDPSLIGYEWDDSQPRIQLEPRGDRGYIELRAVKKR